MDHTVHTQNCGTYNHIQSNVWDSLTFGTPFWNKPFCSEEIPSSQLWTDTVTHASMCIPLHSHFPPQHSDTGTSQGFPLNKAVIKISARNLCGHINIYIYIFMKQIEIYQCTACTWYLYLFHEYRYIIVRKYHVHETDRDIPYSI